jgi:hypothetical protein
MLNNHAEAIFSAETSLKIYEKLNTADITKVREQLTKLQKQH